MPRVHYTRRLLAAGQKELSSLCCLPVARALQPLLSSSAFSHISQRHVLYPLRVHPKPAAGCVAPTSSDAYLSALNGETGTATSPPPHVFALDVNITASRLRLAPLQHQAKAMKKAHG